MAQRVIQDPLEREKREIARRRERMAERRGRLLNAPTRKFGRDVNALTTQIQYKKEVEQAEANRDREWESVMNQHAALITQSEQLKFLRQKNEAEELRKENAALAEAANARRENEAAYRKEDNDNDCALLTFGGVDSHKSEREAEQKKQLQEWLDIQMQYSQEKLRKEREEEREYDVYQQRINEVKQRVQAQAESNRASERTAYLQSNEELAQAKKTRERLERERDQAETAQQRAYVENSAIMQEVSFYRNPMLGHTQKGGIVDTVPYAFKGFNQEQKNAIRAEQAQQIAYKQQLKQQELEEEQAYQEQQTAIHREMLRVAQQQADNQREEREALRNDLLQQKKEHKMHTQYLDNVVYQNPVSNDFFSQFGTSDR
jgi:hypothetical protein